MEDKKLMSTSEVVELLRSHSWIVKNAKKLAKEAEQNGLNDYTAEHYLNCAAMELINLAEVIESGRDVYLICDKYPRGNLDTGRHWYSIIFVNRSGKIERFWAMCLMDRQKSGSFGYSSHALGMSRAMDATDFVFKLVEKIGGKYIQPNVL